MCSISYACFIEQIFNSGSSVSAPPGLTINDILNLPLSQLSQNYGGVTIAQLLYTCKENGMVLNIQQNEMDVDPNQLPEGKLKFQFKVSPIKENHLKAS